jgi:hypothetical protein
MLSGAVAISAVTETPTVVAAKTAAAEPRGVNFYLTGGGAIDAPLGGR